MKKIIFIYMIIIMASVSFAQTAQEIVSVLEKIKTYQADFVQKTEIEGFGEDTYTGKLYIISRNSAMWNYESPYWQFYLFDAATMKYYDSETRQMIIQALNPATNAFMRLMLDPGKIGDDFQLTLSGSELTMTSKENLGIEAIVFTIADDAVTGIKTKDANGNKTVIEFNNIKKNGIIDEAVFKPALPEGTEVFEYK